MRNKLKTLMAVTVLGAATLGLYSGNGNAADSTVVHPVPVTAVAAKAESNHRFHRHFWKMHHHKKGPWHLGLNRNKHLTAADARIITQAALLMRGQHQLQVGSIDTKTNKWGRPFYVINIVNQQNKVAKVVVLNSMNGHIYPLHQFKR